MNLLKFNKKFSQKLFLRLIYHIHGREKVTKVIEYVRGLYRYPKKMLGRKFSHDYTDDRTDVLVFAAHPDDDILGLGTTLIRHSKNGDNIKVIFVTNGSGGIGESWNLSVGEAKRRSDVRYLEAVKALSLINIPEENITCLGYPDGGTQRYLKNMLVDFFMLIQEINPERIYVHCIEGGHCDHDMTSYVVKSICNKIGFNNVFEWTEYNSIQPIGTNHVKFLPSQSTSFQETIIDISADERILKRKMLAMHHSQDVEKFFLQGEAIRQANITQIENDLYEHCQLSKRKLIPLVTDFNKAMMKLKRGNDCISNKRRYLVD